MAISYPLSFPTARGVAQITVRGLSVTAESTSPFTLQSQIQVFPGQMWTGNIGLPPMKRVDAEVWIAFLLSLNGRQGTFLMGDPTATAPQGVGTGTPLVNGGSQTGNVLVIDGATNSTTNWLKAGDYFHMVVGGQYRLHKVLQNANSDGSGNVSLTIWPNLRESPPDNTALVLVNPKGQWRLDQSFATWDVDVGLNFTQNFPIKEAL